MTNNRKIANSVFNELRNEGLVPVNVQFSNGYFIFEKGEDAVVHFKIKGVNKWKFGMWIDINDVDKAVQVFAQHIDYIDKFKPSCSTFCEVVSRETLLGITKKKSNSYWAYYRIIKMVKHIKNNPRLAFVQEGTYSKYVPEPLIKLYLKEEKEHCLDRLYENKEHLVKDILAYRQNQLAIKVLLAKKLPVIKSVTLIDRNAIGVCRISPRYEVRFVFNRVSNNKKIQGKKMNDAFDSVKLFTKTNTDFTFFLEKVSRDTEWYAD